MIRGAGGLEHSENFLNDRLYWAFFHGLGNAGDLPEESAVAIERRGEVPFLNGGLFEMQEYDRRNRVHIPNDKFAEILELFERYNFTVTESTPLDIEVAVDPEMLGKVFEELVTGRHDTGSYYTPRPVVSFMCRESLKICLQNKTDETEECLKRFVDDGDATAIRDPEKLLKVLQTLRICDPACGSGAYLLGMMSELLRLREALFQTNQIDSTTTYQRKLDIIQQNLYGVDKDDFATNIAMLRLWLSLAVDFEGDTPEPLPNLDYKVATGDSLTGPAPEPPDEQIRHEDHLIRQIQEHKAEYSITYIDPEKQELREAIAELKRQLHGWQPDADGFIWQVEFSEVFQEGGFDVVIGNPPYVRQELIRPIKPTLRRLFPEVYAGTADLYVYFYKRGTELLRTSGVLTYISSNSFLRAGFSKKLRGFFAGKMRLQKLLDFGSIPVFRAHVDTCIFLVENTEPNGTVFLAATVRDQADIPRLSEAFQEHAISMRPRDLSAEGWVLTSAEAYRLLEKLENVGTSFEEYVDGGFYRGMTIGCNEAFIINEFVRQQLIFENANSSELIKPSLRGRTLKKWKVEATNEYMIVIASSTNEEWPWSNARNASEAERIFERTYPAIYQHLNSYRERLIAREDQGKFYWELRSCAYYAGFAKPKIIYPQTAKSLYACYDTDKTFGVNSIYFIPTDDLSLLAILNSQLFDWYARHKFQSLNDPWAGGRLQFLAQYMKHVPIVDRTATQRAELTNLVERILADPESGGVRDIERKIDVVVYQLYGLTDAEIELIKRSYRDAGMEV
ncbi:type I restriction endonuclease subunit M [Candidatus Poribacteria bacterium]|nr:MAG: type I restriction endonuclease subunit M [Candidatus Poribacteria bacterium]